MDKRRLLPEQQAAAYEISKHISVTAGPGSGKTTVLVERYLHILRKHKLSIDQIVAITFTNRAANEMRERLRRELNQILQTTDSDERRRWLNYKRTLDGAVITTIHGFCARLLREFPVEAQVDPQFVLLDEHRAAMLLESVVEEVLTTFISGGHIEVSRLTLGVGRAKLAAALAQLYRDVRSQGLSFEELSLITARTHANEDDHARSIADLDQAMTTFLSVRAKTDKAKDKMASLASAWPPVQKLLRSIPSHEELADYCREVEGFRTARPDARGDIADQVKALDALVWDNNLRGHAPQVCLDLFARQYALEMVLLLTEIDRHLNLEKQRLAALDFDDLELRTLALLGRPEVQTRASERYQFFLVDEFQDTNGLQKQLLERLALAQARRPANLFIVGDPKQSIYGFRGADVSVFREMTTLLLESGGVAMPLQLNFRSQPPLITFFNHLFARLFSVPGDLPATERDHLDQLGFVSHENSEPKRELRDAGPLVEVLVSTSPAEEDEKADEALRVLDAQQIARRIISLRHDNADLNYSDIALLFRAMTKVQVYESVLRRANIPYQTILGRGFYEREEITDLIQLLRFLDNKTDELALAAILRSPLCGISDNALLALRTAPRLDQLETGAEARVSLTRPLYKALREHREIAYIESEEHQLLDRAANLITHLISRRHHSTIEDLLRFAVAESEYLAVIAANFDGAQRLANVERLFTLAARFESSGTHLIRDFVRYVEEFEAIGSRESEGQIDEATNAVKLMTIHQAKGLEFPVVIIPELQRLSRVSGDNWVLLDRHQGLTLKVPDGRGRLVAGHTFNQFDARQNLREKFESMRLLYVAATRAQDRLILSGASEQLSSIVKQDSWLKWIWQTLELESQTETGAIDLADDVRVQLTINLAEPVQEPAGTELSVAEQSDHSANSLAEAFPLLKPVAPERVASFHRFSVTQLINYQRCPRQYYFDRVLQLPSADELAVWNNAEAPEPPANLTATLKGAVIHRFCERYRTGQDVEDCLRQSFIEVVKLRQAQLADRLAEINVETAIKDLLPLANNYLASDVFQRIEQARVSNSLATAPGDVGLWSELSFRLRRPLGVLTGVIDKLLITRNGEGEVEVEIIDFKTNRISGARKELNSSPSSTSTRGGKPLEQFAFDFERSTVASLALDGSLESVARDYQLQMQAYALAVGDLMPALSVNKIRVTLHFLDPNVEVHLEDRLLEGKACAGAIDSAMLDLVSSSDPSEFPVKPATHCRMCNFLTVCPAGREFVPTIKAG